MFKMFSFKIIFWKDESSWFLDAYSAAAKSALGRIYWTLEEN